MRPSRALLHPEKTRRILLRGRTRTSREARQPAVPLALREAKSLPSWRVNEYRDIAAMLRPQTGSGVQWERRQRSLAPGEHISTRGAFDQTGTETETQRRSSRKAPPRPRALRSCRQQQILGGAVESRPRTMVRLRENCQTAPLGATREGHQAVETEPRGRQ